MAGRCPDHPKSYIIEDQHSGDAVCETCGRVFDGLVDVHAEWTFPSENGAREDPSRVGPAENPHRGSSGLSTTVAPSASGQVSYGKARLCEKTHKSVLIQISDISDKMQLSLSTVTLAKETFSKVYEGQDLRNKKKEAIAAACVYHGCRQDSAARTVKEIVPASGATERDIHRAVKELAPHAPDIEQIDSRNYMERFCFNLDLDYKTVGKAATRIAKKVDESDPRMARGNAIHIAAASLYMACQHAKIGKSMKDIADGTKVFEATIKDNYKDMEKHAAELISHGFNSK